MEFTKQEIEIAKSKDLKLWVVATTHNDFGSGCAINFEKFDIDIFKYNDIYKPFVTSDLESYKDKENINEYSPFFNEFVCMYYVWKNNIKSQYVGFCHYRRILPITYIAYDDLDKGKIQFFCYFNSKNLQSDYLKREAFKHTYQHYYEYINCNFCEIDHLYNDLEEYLNTQNILKQEQIIKYTTNENVLRIPFISRELYVCKWEEFDKLMKFINGYIEFIKTKHNIYTFNDFIKFYNECINYKIIEYYKNNNSCGIFLNKNQESSINNFYENITSSETYKRIYGFIIEELIGLFISLSKNSSPHILEKYSPTYNDTSYYKIHKLLKNNNSQNIVIYDNFDYSMSELLNLYKIKNENSKITFLNNRFLIDLLNEYKDNKNTIYLKNFVKENLKAFNDISNLNNIDFIILNFEILQKTTENKEYIINLFNYVNNNCTLILISHNNEIDNFLEKLKKKFNINLSFIKGLSSYYEDNTLYIIRLNKKEKI